MRWPCIAIFAVLTPLACGGGEPPAPQQTTSDADGTPANRAPVLSSARVLPTRPQPGERLALAIRVLDPEGDPLQMNVEWFHNGRSAQKGGELDFAASFVRGDRVHAEVTVSDGQAETSVTTDAVVFANQLPRIARLALHPPAPSAGDTLTALADAADPDGDSFDLHYRWEVNRRVLPGESGATLEPGAFTRGDSVRVAVAASDAEGEGDWVRSSARVIANGMPEITSDPAGATVSSGSYRYALKAVDPDGDRPLRYRLVEGPDGMAVDLLSGVVSWRVPESAGGAFPVEVAVSDPRGGEARQSYTVELHWEAVPADTP